VWGLVACSEISAQDERVQIGRLLLSVHRCLCELGNVARRVPNRTRPRSTPERDEDILNVVNGTLGVSTRGVSLQVSVAGSTVRRVLREELYPCPLQPV
jgi:hypothetical protein